MRAATIHRSLLIVTIALAVSFIRFSETPHKQLKFEVGWSIAEADSAWDSIAAVNDDMHTTDRAYQNLSYAMIGNNGSGTLYDGGFRFSQFPVPQGKHIDSCFLWLPNAISVSSAVTVIIYGVASDDAPQDLDSTTFYYTDVLTTASVTWNVENWPNTCPPEAGCFYRSPDISAVIQEVVDRSGYAQGQALNIHILYSGQGNTSYRRIYTRENGVTYCARAEIFFSDAAPQQTPKSHRRRLILQGETL